MTVETLAYVIDNPSITLPKLNAEIAALWSALLTPESQVRKNAEAIGIPCDSLPREHGDIIAVDRSAAGLEMSLIEFIVTLTGTSAAQRVGRDLWVYVILPWLRQKYGDKALRESQRKLPK